MRTRFLTLSFGTCALATALVALSARAQQPAPSKSAEPKGEAAPQVIIDRSALQLIDPGKFQVPLHLDPAREIVIVAPVDGIVRTIPVKPGEKVNEQAEILSLDSTEQELRYAYAKANHRAAQLEVEIAKGEMKELAEAKLEAATAEVELAEFRLAQTRLKAPFNGQIFRIEAEVGQFVRAGEALLTVADPSVLVVEVPVDRAQASVGKPIEIFVEETAVQANAESILPLHERFEPLRTLLQTVTSAIVTIPNTGSKFQPGQTVNVALMPRDPIVEVAAESVGNGPDGTRLVKVLRAGVVRDIPARLLGAVSPERTYVSGSFAQGDELIVKSSQELPDGTQVRPAIAGTPAETAAAPAEPKPKPPAPAKNKTGF